MPHFTDSYLPGVPSITESGTEHLYHVMNRGRARHTIFHNRDYYEAFLETLKEVVERFDAVIHAYCLMGNHYHLLVETPKANLSRIMRHVNGVYTQRYNRMRKTDGPLFRGRYKSILVDEDAYLLQLSRYIHRNPIDMKRPVTRRLEDSPWSSYCAYLNLTPCPVWLSREKIYQMLGKKRKYHGYQTYVAQGVDDDTLQHYKKGNILAVLGDRTFRESVRRESEAVDLDKLRKVLQDRPPASHVINLIAQVLGVEEQSITKQPSGRRMSNPARAFAMYACQQYGAMSLKEIARVFELNHSGSASFSINKIKNEIADGDWDKLVRMMEASLYIVK
jgi:putative transposase